jgi:Family of unknown function (DUF6401)
MTNDFLAFASAQLAVPGPVLDPDTALLDEMMARVGVDGLTAAFGNPAVLAHVDQHAAAVRDALTASGRQADTAGLAAYAKSIAFAAKRAGRSLPEPGHAPTTAAAWLTADWHAVRLVAVCALAV